MKANTEQMAQTRDEKGRITGGAPPAGFNAHPENRHNGAWKKEDSARFKLEQMMKLTAEELQDIMSDNSAPMFEGKLAEAIFEGRWKDIEGMINQVYGKPKESVDVTSNGEALTALVRFEGGDN